MLIWRGDQEEAQGWGGASTVLVEVETSHVCGVPSWEFGKFEYLEF